MIYIAKIYEKYTSKMLCICRLPLAFTNTFDISVNHIIAYSTKKINYGRKIILTGVDEFWRKHGVYEKVKHIPSEHAVKQIVQSGKFSA